MTFACKHCGYVGEPITRLDFIKFKGDRSGKTDQYVCPKCGSQTDG